MSLKQLKFFFRHPDGKGVRNESAGCRMIKRPKADFVRKAVTGNTLFEG